MNQGANGSAVTAVSNTGYHFVDWSDSSTVNPRTDSNVQANISVTANFAINTYTLVYAAGEHGSISGTTPQTVNYGDDGSAVTAVPDTGYHFVGWSDSSTANPRTDTDVKANINVTANFAINKYTLTVSSEGSGSINKSPNQANYDHGTIVQLTAEPADGWNFSNWSGDLTGSNNPASITMTNNKTITAVFIENGYLLTISVVGSGSVSRTPDQVSYTGGSSVQLTAAPADGWTFDSWSGNITGSENPASILINGEITVTATFIQSNDNSGGFSGGFGGGGGSSGGGLAGPGITNLAVYTNSEGYFNIATIAQSEDGLVQLAIDKGVVAKDKEGQGLKAVSIKEATETPPPPAKAIFIGQVFDFGPDGATFTPPVPLTFSYDRDLLPQGLTDYSLSIVTRDAAAGSWVEIGGEVNQAAGTITVPVSHFSQYAVIAHTRPASFTIKSLTVSPAEANVGEEITVDVTTANTGDQPGEYTIVLKINGNTESTQKASIEGNASKLLSFKFTRDAPDTYEIDVNGQTATFTIMAPPGPAVLLLKSLAVNPYETTYGETINISVLAENTGSFALQDTLTLMIDGVVVDRREVDIAPYTAETITFSMANIEPGSRTIDINGQQTNFIVKPLLSPKVKAAINWYLIGLLIFLLTATSSTVGFYLKIKPQEIPVVPPRIKK